MNENPIRRYSELIKYNTLQERFDYLKLNGTVGESTFGFDRYLNQDFYHSKDWKNIRRQVITRDYGMDLGVDGFSIYGRGIYIHHMNPITTNDIRDVSEYLMNPEYLISCSHKTHQAIHYGDISLLPKEEIERKPGDTALWRTNGNLL